MDCKFVVGQKVVCIADGWTRAWLSDTAACPVVKGQIYVIRAIFPFMGRIMVRLKEHPDHQFGHEGFRPLQERPKEADTDISIFNPLLNVRENEPA